MLGIVEFTDPRTGRPLAHGQVETYESGTDTPAVTWANREGTIANDNPVILNDVGQAFIFGDGRYKFVVKDKCGSLIQTYDPVGWDLEPPAGLLPDLELEGVAP